ncbi:MAG: hypothetical protein ACYC8T_37500, partial [Myxococcaceae bacterium]
MFRNISSAVRRLVTTANTRRRPPHGQAQTSQPHVRACNVAQSSRGRFSSGSGLPGTGGLGAPSVFGSPTAAAGK